MVTSCLTLFFSTFSNDSLTRTGFRGNCFLFGFGSWPEKQEKAKSKFKKPPARTTTATPHRLSICKSCKHTYCRKQSAAKDKEERRTGALNADLSRAERTRTC